MGSYDSWKRVTRDAAAVGHKILDFCSTLSKLRLDASEPINGKGTQITRNQMYLFWKPTIATQRHRRSTIYRTDHVLHHFVHYCWLVTKTTATCYKDSDTTSSSWEYSCDINVEQPVPVVDEVYEAIICCTEDLPRNTVNHENNSVEAQISPSHHAKLAFRGHAG